MSPRSWDAETYDRVSDVQVAWAKPVLKRLPLRGNERVLDAGSGTGRVTKLLLERLPEGHVVAVDSSAEMIEFARAALGERATVLQSDLTELGLDEPVDAVFSNAVFHWVLDHGRLFERLHAALRPGGRLVAQCGGEGNIEEFLSVVDSVAAQPPFDEHLSEFMRTWYFASAEETEKRLLHAGFESVSTSLEPSEVTPDEPAGFLRTVCLRVHLDERLPEDLHDLFVAEVLERCGTPLRLDYVRLNIDARRAG